MNFYVYIYTMAFILNIAVAIVFAIVSGELAYVSMLSSVVCLIGAGFCWDDE